MRWGEANEGLVVGCDGAQSRLVLASDLVPSLYGSGHYRSIGSQDGLCRLCILRFNIIIQMEVGQP